MASISLSEHSRASTTRLQPSSRANSTPGGAGDGHLRRDVDRESRARCCRISRQMPTSCTTAASTPGGDHRAHVLLGLGHLVLEDQDVEGDVALHAAPVQELHQLRQIGLGEVVRPHPGVELLQAEVDRVRAVLDRGPRALPIARRRQQLGQAGQRARSMTRFPAKRSAPVPRLDWSGCSASANQNLALKPARNKGLFERRVNLFRRCPADAFRDQQFNLLSWCDQH